MEAFRFRFRLRKIVVALFAAAVVVLPVNCIK